MSSIRDFIALLHQNLSQDLVAESILLRQNLSQDLVAESGPLRWNLSQNLTRNLRPRKASSKSSWLRQHAAPPQWIVRSPSIARCPKPQINAECIGIVRLQQAAASGECAVPLRARTMRRQLTRSVAQACGAQRPPAS